VQHFSFSRTAPLSRSKGRLIKFDDYDDDDDDETIPYDID